MRYLGLGLVDAWHPWSEKDHGTYTSAELLDHLVNKVIPLENSSTLPTEAPTTAPELPTFQKVGTVSQLSLEKEQFSRDEHIQFKLDGQSELERRQENGQVDVWSEKQSTLPPKLADMKGLEIEMCFNYPGEDGSQILDWYRGTIESMVSKKKRSFKIKLSIHKRHIM